MTTTVNRRAHVIAGGFPAGNPAGHDHDYARLQILNYLAEQEIPASVGNDFSDVEKWLAVSQLLITYVAGPHPDEQQCSAIQRWIEAGGRWLGFHGTAGGRAEDVPGFKMRRTIKLPHHALLGCYFLTHPAIQPIQLQVGDGPESLLRGVPPSFDVVDEPYFIELQDPSSTHILLSADFGPDCVSPLIGPVYAQDTSLQADGKTRVLGYTREVGRGGVTYFALGHCHNPAIRALRPPDRIDPTDTTPDLFHGSWESPMFQTLVRNAIGWGVGS